jgi:catechol 2,3-dioxygenase-like lactoylglutathione lyase family enzyme
MKGWMTMNFVSPLIAVKNVKASRKFYEEVLGMKMTLDLGQNISFGGKLAIQENYSGLVGNTEMNIAHKPNDHELYFEEENFDAFEEQLNKLDQIEYLHRTKEYPWGQRVIRFYDPDGHIIEVGESMESIFKRYLSQGMSAEEVAERTMHPVEFVKLYIN